MNTITDMTIAVILAAPQEREPMQPILDLLGRLGIPCQVQIIPSWAATDLVPDWAEFFARRDYRVALVAAGAEPHLPGLIAAVCPLPVIAVPLRQSPWDADMTLRLALRGSAAAPVAGVELGGAEQAAMLALRILAAADPALAVAIDTHRQTLVEEIEARNEALFHAAWAPDPEQEAPERSRRKSPEMNAVAPTPMRPAADIEYAEDDQGPVEIRPADLTRPLSGAPVQASERPAAIPLQPITARKIGRRRIDPDAPSVELIEEAVDCLLEGGAVALPTDTVYGVAVDATNPAAVARLYEIKGRPRNKAITLLVDSPRLLAGIACNLTIETRRLMEAFWPGPLTIVFQKRGGNFSHVSDTDTIGVRMPDHSIPLAIIQALARPLACTSANLSGQPEAHGADEVERYLGGRLDMLMDCGSLAASPASTVIDVTCEPYKILRIGAVSHEQLAAIVGDKLDQEG